MLRLPGHGVVVIRQHCTHKLIPRHWRLPGEEVLVEDAASRIEVVEVAKRRGNLLLSPDMRGAADRGVDRCLQSPQVSQNMAVPLLWGLCRIMLLLIVPEVINDDL